MTRDQDERVTKALERIAQLMASVAESLAKLANPPMVMGTDGVPMRVWRNPPMVMDADCVMRPLHTHVPVEGKTIQEWGRAQEQHILDRAKPTPNLPRGNGSTP